MLDRAEWNPSSSHQSHSPQDQGFQSRSGEFLQNFGSISCQNGSSEGEIDNNMFSSPPPAEQLFPLHLDD